MSRTPIVAPAVMEVLRKHGRLSALQITKRLPGAYHKSVRRALCLALDAGEIHIDHWVKEQNDNGRKYPRPVYRFGPGENARKPAAMTPSERGKAWRTRKPFSAKKMPPNSVFDLARWMRCL